jgi:hypothetical protein
MRDAVYHLFLKTKVQPNPTHFPIKDVIIHDVSKCMDNENVAPGTIQRGASDHLQSPQKQFDGHEP